MFVHHLDLYEEIKNPSYDWRYHLPTVEDYHIVTVEYCGIATVKVYYLVAVI
jgi:hypothetical protein